MKANTTEPHARERVAYEAAAQIEALARMLRREHTVDDGTGMFPEIFTSTLCRINELNSVVLSVVGDDTSREIDEMRTVVHGDEEGAR